MLKKLRDNIARLFSNPGYLLRNKFTKVTAFFKKKYINIFKKTEITYSTFGAKIHLDFSKDVDKRLFLYGFEHETMQYYYKSIKKNDIILDIGANIGIY